MIVNFLERYKMSLIEKIFRKKRVGLALGGGAVLGAAHIGVLKALEEQDIKIDYISGTSIGAFVASLYAFGKSWQDIKEISEEMKWIDISGVSLSKYGLLNNKKMGHLFHEILGDVNIKDAQIPLAIVAANAANGEKMVFTEGKLSDAIMASTAIPGIFQPVEFKDHLLVDGGVIENVPIRTCRDLGANYVIGVDLNAKHQYDKPHHIIDVILNSFHFIMQQNAALQTQYADLLIKPDLSEFNRADMHQVKKLFEKGYEETIIQLNDLN